MTPDSDIEREQIERDLEATCPWCGWLPCQCSCHEENDDA